MLPVELVASNFIVRLTTCFLTFIAIPSYFLSKFFFTFYCTIGPHLSVLKLET